MTDKELIRAQQREIAMLRNRYPDPSWMAMLECKAKLFDAIESAARDMPEGYAVVLEIEAGTATVRWGRTGEDGYLIDSADRMLAEQIEQATKDAMETDHEQRTSWEP